MAFLISSEHKHGSTMLLHCCLQGYSQDLSLFSHVWRIGDSRQNELWRKQVVTRNRRPLSTNPVKNSLEGKRMLSAEVVIITFTSLHLQGIGRSPKLRKSRRDFFYRMSHNHTRGPVLSNPFISLQRLC